MILYLKSVVTGMEGGESMGLGEILIVVGTIIDIIEDKTDD